MEAAQRPQEAEDLYLQLAGNIRHNAERARETLLTQLGAVNEEDFDALIHIISQR